MRFEYIEPSTVGEALSILERHGAKARVLAGGTDLVARLKDGKTDASHVVSLVRIPGLDRVAQDANGVRIGALATISTLENSSVLKTKYSSVAEVASQIASPGIRNLATVGGNLCSASPSGDMAPALMILDARVRVEGPGGPRELPLTEFFVGPWLTVLGADEILVSIDLPEPRADTGSAYLKYAIRENDLAVVGAGAAITVAGGICHRARVALSAVAPTPIRASRAETFLEGKQIGESEMAQAGQLAAEETKPRQDSMRVDPDYRRDMAALFVRRAIAAAIERVQEVAP